MVMTFNLLSAGVSLCAGQYPVLAMKELAKLQECVGRSRMWSMIKVEQV
jgi:hypothetical protein